MRPGRGKIVKLSLRDFPTLERDEVSLRFHAADILGRTAPVQTFAWTDRDYMLYALALGMGSHPANDAASAFVYEKDLRVVPTFPTVLAWIVEPTLAHLGAAPEFALHAGQKIEVHSVLTGSTTVAVRGVVVAVHDKGRDRGALIVMRHEVVRASDGQRVATLTTRCFARDCGGCGSGGEPQPIPQGMPAREADCRITYAVRSDAALLYRLTGDRNPLHADPGAARRASFAGPILHGLCTFGMTCRAVLQTVAACQPERIASHEARFSAPVYPGELLEIALWRDHSTVSFEASVPAREVKVLTGGQAQLR
jgi:acyl dehydratase